VKVRAAAILLAISLASTTVLAQPKAAEAPVKTLAESLTGEAKQAYDGAILLYSDNDFEGALAKFSRAYEISKDARLLWNMATCEKGARHYYKTYELIDRYLKEGAGALTVDVQARAEETKRTLRDLFSLVELHVEPADAKVLADNAPMPGGLDLGIHKLRVQAEGFETQERALDVPGKSPVVIEIKLKRVVAPARLSVVTEANAVITVDGHASTGQWEGPLAPGKHKVEVTASGKLPYFADVELGEGANRSMLVPLKDKGGIPIWVWIGGGVLLAGAGVLTTVLVARATESPPPLVGKLGTIDLSFFR
jgi:hypothetical protein